LTPGPGSRIRNRFILDPRSVTMFYTLFSFLILHPRKNTIVANPDWVGSSCEIKSGSRSSPKGSVPDPNPPDPHVFGPPRSGSIPKCHGSGNLPKGQCSFIFVQLPRCKKIKDEPRKYWHACDNCDYTASLPRYT
jgi:hypothetical protein